MSPSKKVEIKPYTRKELEAVPKRQDISSEEKLLIISNLFELMKDAPEANYSLLGKVTKAILTNDKSVPLAKHSTFMRRLKQNKVLFEAISPYIFNGDLHRTCRCGHLICKHFGFHEYANNFPYDYQSYNKNCRSGRCECKGINIEDFRFTLED